MNYDGILWDWNGTLLDDADYCIASVNVSLKKRSLPLLTKEKYYEIFRFPIIDYYRDLGFDFSKDPYDRLAEEYTATYVKNFHTLPLRKEAKEVLAAFRSKNVPQYILSASGRDALVDALDLYGITDRFDAIVCADDCLAEGKIAYGKRFVSSLPNSPRLLLVGDSAHDFETAKAVGADCVLVTEGHASEKQLRSFGVPVIRNLAELYPIVFGASGAKRPVRTYRTPAADERRCYDINEAEPKTFAVKYKDFYDDLKNTNKTEDW